MCHKSGDRANRLTRPEIDTAVRALMRSPTTTTNAKNHNHRPRNVIIDEQPHRCQTRNEFVMNRLNLCGIELRKSKSFNTPGRSAGPSWVVKKISRIYSAMHIYILLERKCLRKHRTVGGNVLKPMISLILKPDIQGHGRILYGLE